MSLKRRYKTIKVLEDRYVDLVRLRAWLELKYRRRITFDEVFEYLFDNLPEEAREIDLESAVITVKGLSPEVSSPGTSGRAPKTRRGSTSARSRGT